MLVFSVWFFFFSCLSFPIIFFTWYNLCSMVYCNCIKWLCPKEKPQLLLQETHQALTSRVSLQYLLGVCESDVPTDNLADPQKYFWLEKAEQVSQLCCSSGKIVLWRRDRSQRILYSKTIGKTSWIWRWYPFFFFFGLFKTVLGTHLNSLMNESQQSSSLCLMWTHVIFLRLVFKFC